MSEQQQVAAVEQPPPEKTAQQLLEEQKQRQEQEKARQEQRKKLEQEARVKRQEDMKKLQQALKGSLSGLSKSADNTSMINTKLTLAEKQLQRVFPSILKFNNILHLDINTNSLSDISILTQFSHLLTLNLSKNQIPSLDAFASDGKLLKLQFLNLSSNKIKQFTQVSLPSLRKLNLNENQINIVKNWKGHANISILELRKNKFKNLKGIVNMKNLTQLYVCENQISDIRGLEGLNALAKLSVRNNKIKKIMKPFPYLPSLIHLNLRENQIPNIKELAKIDQHVLIINLLANPATDELGQNLKKQVCWLLPHITKINKSAVTQEERLGFEKERLEKIAQQQKQRLQKQEQARKAAEQPPPQ